MGELSPTGRDTDSLLAGNALGTMFTELRFRGFVTTREDMVTGERQAWSASPDARRQEGGTERGQGSGRTSILVSEEQSRPVVGPAADVAHAGERWMATKAAGIRRCCQAGRLAGDWRDRQRARGSGSRRDRLGGRHLAPECVGLQRDAGLAMSKVAGKVCGGDSRASTAFIVGGRCERDKESERASPGWEVASAGGRAVLEVRST